MAEYRRVSTHQVKIPDKLKDTVNDLNKKKSEIKHNNGGGIKEAIRNIGVASDYPDLNASRVNSTPDSGNNRIDCSDLNATKVSGCPDLNATKSADPTVIANDVSYADIVGNSNNSKLRSLNLVPTFMNDGGEVVIFDEELVNEGSKKWLLTACGYFLGCSMAYSAMNYNLRRMWSKLGLKDIIMDNNQICYFKFDNEIGLNKVIDQSPCMVNGKPLVVRKWDPEVAVEKVEPSSVPVWVKMTNVPLEAWSSKGISALASRMGKPIVMDNTTTTMCHDGIGSATYARVLVEVEATKGFVDDIEVLYKDKDQNIKATKKVNVEYTWKPKLCSHCVVFGHNHEECKLRPKTVQEVEHKAVENKVENKVADDGFEEVKRKKVNKEKQQNSNGSQDNGSIEKNSKTKWKLNGKSKVKFQKSANKYAVLSESDDDLLDPRLILKLEELERKKKKGCSENDESYDDVADTQGCSLCDNDLGPASWNIRGMSVEDKQDEIRNLIRDEHLSICAVLETHLKSKSIEKACNRAFGNWEWSANLKYSANSCRIILGWNDSIVKVSILHVDRQQMFCFFELRNEPVSWYGTIVYASNLGRERKKLWAKLGKQKLITRINHGLSWGISMLLGSWMSMQQTKSLKNPECNVLKKLDRILINEEFLNKFPRAYGRFMPYLISDHSPAVLGIKSGIIIDKKSFRFMNYIAYKDSFLDTVEEGWSKDLAGHDMFKLVKNLKNMKRSLKKLNWQNGDLHNKVSNLKEDLKLVQTNIDINPFDKELRHKAKSIIDELEIAKADEFRPLQQKTKMIWLTEGDKNTKFFYSILKSRKHKSRVESICDEDGVRYYDRQVAEQCVKHFQKFLGESVNVSPIEDIGDIFTKVIPGDVAERMIEEVSDIEIKNAMFDIDINRASGPDGYTSCFFSESMAYSG
ncbi:uncharacterized protein [Rutidosis leptorrhynchoides]|uniref:uncharacterized protein n=1 Tax=Rutidosis leptorrhynchoides TaxID=125765 RepID=UPI003A9A601A